MHDASWEPEEHLTNAAQAVAEYNHHHHETKTPSSPSTPTSPATPNTPTSKKIGTPRHTRPEEALSSKTATQSPTPEPVQVSRRGRSVRAKVPWLPEAPGKRQNVRPVWANS